MSADRTTGTLPLQLVIEIERLRKALEWYADHRNYCVGRPGHVGDKDATDEVGLRVIDWKDDDGRRAREALLRRAPGSSPNVSRSTLLAPSWLTSIEKASSRL